MGLDPKKADLFGVISVAVKDLAFHPQFVIFFVT
jgi:hypothetical protein